MQPHKYSKSGSANGGHHLLLLLLLASVALLFLHSYLQAKGCDCGYCYYYGISCDRCLYCHYLR